MKHDCRLRSLEVFEDEDGYFYCRDQCHMPFGREHTFRVEYCPVCGQKSKKSHVAHMKIFRRTDIPESVPDPLHAYNSIMVQAIQDMNRNIDAIKAFMISQNTQNDCFIERDLCTSQEISYLKRRIEILEEGK